ncbi:short-chain collagen C4-like [Mercenaria mercenaria]|uniref:short-chain collagen C4-like n=1 Tax=Mercenaria mercenaria TaxID=6596 RepID=UPI00234F7451|nr:short-chain collagen C4-like [Mercenaria mercenaria]
MSVFYSVHKDSYVGDTEESKPPPAPPGTVKKSTMYIIVALSVVVTSMMFASTVTVVYLIAKGENKSSGGGNNGPGGLMRHVTESATGNTGTAAPPASSTQSQGQTTRAPVQNEAGNQVSTTRSGTGAPPVSKAQSQGQTTRAPLQTTPSQSQSDRFDLPSPVTTFTRWGKTECTPNSAVLYTGFTAGSRYNYHGGTSNVLCLPKEPQFNSYSPGMSGNYLYGSEYNARNTYLSDIFGKELNEQDVPCAVCEVTGSSAMMVFPARTECYNGWNKQYSGYLMTSHEAHNKSMDVVCIDSEPEAIHDSSDNENGALFYFVETNGQLFKHGYSKGREMTCVVCTK